MKHSQIYLIDKLSEKEQETLKKDLIDHSVQVALKIKNMNLSKNQIEEITKNAVERVLSTYQFSNGNGLGELVKSQVVFDLKIKYEKDYPDQANKVIWPDLDKRKPFDKLVETLQKVKLQPKVKIGDIFKEVNQKLNIKQQKLLSTVYHNLAITYAEISKQFGTRGVMTYREVKIVYTQLIQILKNLGIVL